jgi:CBS domain-containing protein
VIDPKWERRPKRFSITMVKVCPFGAGSKLVYPPDKITAPSGAEDPMNWKANSPLSVDQDRTLEQAESSMPVRLIATFDGLETTTPESLVSEALATANKGGFDYLPVRHVANGLIIGLFDRSSPQMEDQLVSEVYQPIGPTDLISAETSLLHFVWTANQRPRRLVLEGTEISGIVTLSDIQKLPVRIALFSLFIHFELLLTEYLRQKMGSADPLSLLPDDRVMLVREKWQRFLASNMDQDIFSAMDLCDKREVAQSLKYWGDQLRQSKVQLGKLNAICATR